MHKSSSQRAGILLSVFAIVATIISLLASDCDCDFVNASMLALVMYGFRIDILGLDAFPTKYLLFFLLIVLGLGNSMYFGAFSTNSSKDDKSSQ